MSNRTGILILAAAIFIGAMAAALGRYYFGFHWQMFGFPMVFMVAGIIRPISKSRSLPVGAAPNADAISTAEHSIIQSHTIFPTDAQWVSRAIETLQPGYLAIDAPSTIRLGDQEIVAVSIGTAESKAVLDAIASEQKLKVEAVSVHTFMRLDLRGDNFEVEALDKDADKLVVGDQPTTWRYRVRPLKTGEQILEVYAFARFAVPDASRQEIYDLPVVKRSIVVGVNPLYSVREFVKERDKTLLWFVIATVGGALAFVIVFVSGLDSVKAVSDAALRHLLGIIPSK